MSGQALIILPVEGREVRLKAVDGASEMLIAEARGEPARLALDLLERVAEPADDGPADWGGLTVTDFEALVLGLRLDLFGAQVRSDFQCPEPGCDERIEMEFSLLDYLGAVRPRRPKGVEPAADRPGWWRLGELEFRLPSARDQLLAQASADGAGRLAELCLGPGPVTPAARAKVERAMAAMAPEVSGPVEGRCPGCGAGLRAMFHAPSFVIGEMRRAFGLLGEEIDLIASSYHWSEAEILAMPRARRQAYAERIRLRRMAA